MSEEAKDRPIYNRLVFGSGISLDENDDKSCSSFAPVGGHGGKYKVTVEIVASRA